MYLVTRMKTITERNDDGVLEKVVAVDDARVELDVQDLSEKIALGDDRVQGIRIFHMGVDDTGEPRIGTEVEP